MIKVNSSKIKVGSDCANETSDGGAKFRFSFLSNHFLLRQVDHCQMHMLSPKQVTPFAILSIYPLPFLVWPSPSMTQITLLRISSLCGEHRQQMIHSVLIIRPIHIDRGKENPVHGNYLRIKVLRLYCNINTIFPVYLKVYW